MPKQLLGIGIRRVFELGLDMESARMLRIEAQIFGHRERQDLIGVEVDAETKRQGVAIRMRPLQDSHAVGLHSILPLLDLAARQWRHASAAALICRQWYGQNPPL